MSPFQTSQIFFEALTMTLPQIKLEFQPEHVQYLTFSLYCGLLFGAVVWGFGADVFGRRISWNVTLFLTAVFSISVGGAPNFAGMCALLACTGLGSKLTWRM